MFAGVILLLFGILNLSSVQNYAKERIVTELKNKLQVNLGIESLYFRPFNEIQLNGVYLNDEKDSTILLAKAIQADFDLLPLLDNQLLFTSAKLSDFDIHLSKDSANAPLNIQFIIDAFKPKDNTKKTPLDVKISSVNIADGRFRFDLNDKPYINNKFDANHIEVTNLNAKLALKSLVADSLNIQVKKLALKEKSGFEIQNLIVRLISNKNHLSVKGLELDLPKSLLHFEKCEVDFTSAQTPQDLLKHANFDVKISQSYIVFKDIAAFVPALENFKDRILFKTRISGKLDSISVSDLSLDYGEKMHLKATGALQNVSDKDKMYVQATVDNLIISKEGLEGLINNFSKDKKNLPKEIANLGTISFKGSLSGLLKQLHGNGSLVTALGTINANLSFGFKPNGHTDSFFKGSIVTTDFQLGKLLSNNDIENIALNFKVDASKPIGGKLSGAIDGLVEKIVYKKYAYQNINIDGNFSDKKYDGLISFDDENGSIRADGLFDLSEKEPVLNFVARLKNVRFDKFNLSDKHKNSYLSMAINANFTGKNIDNAQGYISVDSIRFIKPEKLFELPNLTIKAEGLASDRKLSIKSNLINGEVKGAYSFSTLIPSVLKSLHNYIPSLITYNEKTENKGWKYENNLTFDFTINNTENASDVFGLPFIIYSPAKITGFYNNLIDRFKLEAYLPLIKAAGVRIQAGYITSENTQDEIKTTVSGGFIAKNNSINDLTVNIIAKNDLVQTRLSIISEDKKKLKGELNISTLFSKPDKELVTDIHIDACDFVVNSSLWQIGESDISINSKDIVVNNFSVKNKHGNNDQLLAIDGAYSTSDQNEKLEVNLKNIDLEYVFTSLAIEALQFSGYASGTMLVSSIEKQPYAEINLRVNNFGFNDTKLGELKLYSNLDTETKKVVLKGTLINEKNKKTDIDGYINPITQELSIDFDADQVNVAFLNKYVKTLFNNVSGIGTGKVRLFGDFSLVTVEGKAFIQDGGLGITFLNTNYSFTDTVYLKKDLIYFNDIAFKDPKGNTALISGKVAHDYFTNIMYYIGLSGNNFLLYNATEKQNPMFYGTTYGTGSGSISGDEKVLNINANMRTEKNTNIFMNFMDEAASEYSFITYKTKEGKDSANIASDKTKTNRMQTNSGMEINMNFYIDATPDATVDLLMDPVGGDHLRGSGSGAMQFVWGTNRDPMLYGTYLINRGSYNFTFQKILERKFAIQDGSSVQFRGNPFLANIDVKAIYRVVGNLNDLDKEIVRNTGQTNVPVNCILHLSGALQRPTVKLDIELPSADPEIQRQIKSLMNSEDMINRQIVYLLIMSKFYTPASAQTDQRTSDLAAVASATLSTQLSKILSQIDDRWQIGTNFRTTDGNFSSTEVELLLSSKLLNDRILLNGNFGYRDNPLTQDAFIGDIDIEVLINRLGTWRLKAYNHYNEKYYYINNNGRGVQTQGIGLLYKKDFDSLHELFYKPQILDQLSKKDTTRSAPKDTISNRNHFVKMKK